MSSNRPRALAKITSLRLWVLRPLVLAITGIASAFECEVSFIMGIGRSSVGGSLMRASASDIGLLGAVGILVGGYVALGVGFYWIMQPAVFENAGVAAYKPPPATIVVYPEVPFVPPTPAPSASMSPPPSASRSSAAIEPPVEAAFAAAIPEVQEKPALAVPKQTPKRRERTTSRKEPHTSSARNASASPYEFRSVW
jgi:hypothetical protein